MAPTLWLLCLLVDRMGWAGCIGVPIGGSFSAATSLCQYESRHLLLLKVLHSCTLRRGSWTSPMKPAASCPTLLTALCCLLALQGRRLHSDPLLQPSHCYGYLQPMESICLDFLLSLSRHRFKSSACLTLFGSSLQRRSHLLPTISSAPVAGLQLPKSVHKNG